MDMTVSNATPFARKTPNFILSSAALIQTKTAPVRIVQEVKFAENVSQAHHALSGNWITVIDKAEPTQSFEDDRLSSIANARQGWYRMANIREINFLLNPTILGKRTKDRPGLVDPLAYYLS